MGMYPEHLIEVINVDLNESIYDESLENMTAEDLKKPKCYRPNNIGICKGANTSQGLAENDCYTCCLYENYTGDHSND